MIRDARPKDLPEINALLESSGFLGMEESFLKDLCLVGEIDGSVKGVIWCAISRSKSLAYVDYLVVDPAHKGLGVRLVKQVLMRLYKMKAKRVMTLVEDIENTGESLKINEKMGMLVFPIKFKFCLGNIKEMVELWER